MLSRLVSPGSGEAPREPVDLSELLLEIRHLRLQLERSIQTNTALRERLEEQLLRGHKHLETININYLLSSLGKTASEHLQHTAAKSHCGGSTAFLLVSDEGGRSPAREDCDRPRQSSQSEKNIHFATWFNLSFSLVFPGHISEKLKVRLFGFSPDEKRAGHCETDAASSVSGSESDSISGAPSRLVPGHRVWANRNGRHILGLVEDYSALRRQISEGRKLSRGMTAQMQECLHALRHLDSDNQVEVRHSHHPSTLLAASSCNGNT